MFSTHLSVYMSVYQYIYLIIIFRFLLFYLELMSDSSAPLNRKYKFDFITVSSFFLLHLCCNTHTSISFFFTLSLSTLSLSLSLLLSSIFSFLIFINFLSICPLTHSRKVILKLLHMPL